ncbi:PIN domain-containing protein [Jatrophihabitans sp.]|jgi:tRNA(fMet)-specific endonuclease VapC|uniref:PIN domain-containing protein n=1 Tax=Jatrophihabitans sp. TaxID=1932789 RepID=UPI002F0DE30A
MNPDDVPAGPLLIDTDVASWLLTGASQAEPWLPLLRGHLLTLSFATLGELLALPLSRGWDSTRISAWSDTVRRNFVVLPFDATITGQWTALHVRYRGHLRRGGANDLWIAASALAADPALPLATNNLSDFTRVAADYPLRLIHPDL